MVGTTGTGKTSLLRQLIGTHPGKDRFPSTSASRTTISDIEIITSNEASFEAIITFFSEPTIYTNVQECVADACFALWEDIQVPDERLAERLLTHRDLRFRLGYLIGTWKKESTPQTEIDDEWGDDQDGDRVVDITHDEDKALPSQSDIEDMQLDLRSYIRRIRSLANEAKKHLQNNLGIKLSDLTSEDKNAAQELFEEAVQSLHDFDELVGEIMEKVMGKFEHIRSGDIQKQSSRWPISWRFESNDRDEFIREVRKFSSNYASAYGTLLTPLVDGIRIKGPLFPIFSNSNPQLVLIDGEGIGHVDDPASGIASRIARRFADVDVILLVDTAKSPMLEAPTSVLRAVTASGFQQKIAFAFTHFDLLRGQPNLPDVLSQREHVLSSLYQKLSTIREVVGLSAVRTIERELNERCFMLGYLDRPSTDMPPGPIKEMKNLIKFIELASKPATETMDEAHPVYDAAGLILAIQSATREFHSRWKSILFTNETVRKAHWAEIKALNRRIVLNMDGCEYRDLKPVADLVARLSESLTKFLENPISWKPNRPEKEADIDDALSRVQRSVFNHLYGYIQSIILETPNNRWQDAFDHRGAGSTKLRAHDIQAIYQKAAPIPGPAIDTISEKFLFDIRTLLQESIQEGGGELESRILGK